MLIDSWFWVLFVTVILLIIAVVIIAGSTYASINSLNSNGVSWRVQKSVGNTDTMKTGGNNWFLATTANMIIRISKDPANTSGREIVIQNISNGDVVIDTTQLNGYMDGTFDFGKTIAVGQTSRFIFTDTNNLLRST